MSHIHPTAVIDSGAEIAADVRIGPYCIVGGNVRLEKGVVLKSHVVIDGVTEIGEGTVIHPFASIGSAPQDLKYKGEASRLVVGKNNTIREYVTMNPGTSGDSMLTKVGDNCLLMIGAHIAHDCVIGNHVILANNCSLAGHVHIGDYVIIGGMCGVHQFVRIGKHAIVGGMSGVDADIIPYASVVGERAHLAGLNLVGLKRRGFDREEINALRNAYRVLTSSDGTLAERIANVAKDYKDSALVMDVITFMQSETSRSLCLPKDAEAA